MTSKISALTAVTTPAETDQHEVNQGGVSKRETNTQILSLRGLLAQYHNSANITLSTGLSGNINFNTSDYDPNSLVTTGASWVFTAPATGRYDIRLCSASVDPNGFAYANSGDGLRATIYKNGSSHADLAYWDSENGGSGVDHYFFLIGTRSISLTAGDTVAIKIDNFSGQTRLLNANAYIEIHRVA